MFNKLSKKNRRKMLLHIFIYYPLALVLGFSTGIALIKYVSNETPSVGFILFCIIIVIPIAISHISKIYKKLLKEGNHEKDVEQIIDIN